MRISIVFATPIQFWRQYLDVAPGTTVAQAVSQSNFAKDFPEYTDHMPDTGIYGILCEPNRELKPYDRIELYRPLVFDPQQTRRRRALHKTAATKSKMSHD